LFAGDSVPCPLLMYRSNVIYTPKSVYKLFFVFDYLYEFLAYLYVFVDNFYLSVMRGTHLLVAPFKAFNYW
jgi:hypothetical protein